jgi:hypothetical protein
MPAELTQVAGSSPQERLEYLERNRLNLFAP